MKLNHVFILLFFFTTTILFSQQWKQNFKITEPTRVADNAFGFSISTFDGIVAYGVDQAHIGSFENTGKVYIAKANCEGWVIYQELTPPNPKNYCGFGNNVLLKENSLIVSGCDSSKGNHALYIYEKDDNDFFIFKQEISHPEGVLNGGFGFQFALSKNYMVVSAVNTSIVPSNNPLYDKTKGSAYIYEKNNSGNWSFLQKIEASDGKPQHHFGVSVDINKNVIVVGAPKEGQNWVGAAYVFDKNSNSNTWSESNKLVAFDYRGHQTNFGYNVKIDEGIIAVSSGQDSNYNYDNIKPGVTNGNGAVYLYRKKSTKNWTGYQKLTVIDNIAMGLNFGDDLEMFKNQIAIGAQEKVFDSNGNLTALNGRVYMFNKDSDNNWNEYQMITPSLNSSTFATSISMHKQDLFVNAFWDSYDSNDTNYINSTGSVYLFNTYNFKQTEKPILKPSPTLTSCDDLGNGLSSNFNMSNIESYLVEDVEQFVFNYKDALGNILPSPLPENYSNTIPYSETIYVRVENKENPHCFENTQIELEITPSFELNEISNLNECDLLGTGYAFFDISSLDSLLVENPILYDFSYFNGLSSDISQLTNEPYQNSIENFEEITIIVTDKNTLCSKEKIISLNVIPNNANQCSNNSEISTFKIPNFFTPNGDGVNDTWKVLIPSNNISQNHILFIFDRYSKLLKTLNIHSEWDGTYNGNKMPSGDYWYKIVLEDRKIAIGHFSLKR